MRRLLLVCVSAVLPLFAQNQQKFNITGSVVNSATGEPVARALVDVAGLRSVMTGADGHFEVDGVSGTVYVTAKRPGFGSDGHAQQVTPDAATEPIVIKLVPKSRISGTVVDEDGNPVEGSVVQCLHQQIVNGRKEWQTVQGGNTDEAGHFQLEDLTPGSYLVHTNEKQLYMVQHQNSEPARYVYPATFYSGAPSREMAQTIDLAPGQDMKVDMSLHALRAARVSFVTVPRVANMIGTITAGDDFSIVRGSQREPSGEMTFGAVPPGSWKIVVREGRQEGLYGELAIEVASADLNNLKVPVNKLPDIPVLVSGATSPQVIVQLLLKGGQQVMHLSNADPNGQIIIRAVTPGTYRVVVQQYAAHACVTGITSGSVDLMREALVVSAGSSVPPIQVVDSSNCATLSVSANTEAYLIITSNLEGFNTQFPFRTNAQGTTIPDLAPGEYKIYAFDDVQDLEYANPEVMRNYKGQTVELEAGQKASVQLEVNQRASK
jgi:hypothetical protein